MNVIGPQVRALRQQKQLTQEDMVTRCNLLAWSISRGTYAKIESQSRRVSDLEVQLLAQALAVEIDSLYSADD